jgi:hypothetical protein
MLYVCDVPHCTVCPQCHSLSMTFGYVEGTVCIECPFVCVMLCTVCDFSV